MFGDGLQDLVKVEAGGADRLQDLAHGGLLLDQCSQLPTHTDELRRGVGLVRAGVFGLGQPFLPSRAVMLGVRPRGRKR